VSRMSIGISFIFMVILYAGHAVGAADATGDADTSDTAVTEDTGTSDTTLFLENWQAWSSSPENKLPEYALEYSWETDGWFGQKRSGRRIIRLRGPQESSHRQNIQAKNIFGLLQALGDSSRLYNVKKQPDDDLFSLVVLDGLSVTEPGRNIVEDLQAKCQFILDHEKPRPRRFVFSAEFSKESRAAVRQVQIVFTWDYHPFEENFFWLPTDILTQSLVQRGKHQAVLSEHLTLVNVRESYRSGVGEIDMIATESKENEAHD
jgi:hypothetical protein